MKFKKITALFAALLFTFAVTACNNDSEAPDAPLATPAASVAA